MSWFIGMTAPEMCCERYVFFFRPQESGEGPKTNEKQEIYLVYRKSPHKASKFVVVSCLTLSFIQTGTQTMSWAIDPSVPRNLRTLKLSDMALLRCSKHPHVEFDKYYLSVTSAAFVARRIHISLLLRVFLSCLRSGSRESPVTIVEADLFEPLDLNDTIPAASSVSTAPTGSNMRFKLEMRDHLGWATCKWPYPRNTPQL